MNEDERYIVGPVMKALKVLDAIAEKGHPVSLTTLASELGLPKTSAFRYLRTLTAAGFASYDPVHDRYGVGTRFRALATADKSIQRLRSLALPFLSELNREFNETINLAVPAEQEVVYIDIVESTRALRMQARVGSRDPLHSTALGKAILAHLSPEERKVRLSEALAQRTVRTITQLRVIERQLREVARTGAAIEIGENEEGSMCIGVAILDERSHPLAAISLSAPERRISDVVRDRAIARLKEAAARISEGLLRP